LASKTEEKREYLLRKRQRIGNAARRRFFSAGLKAPPHNSDCSPQCGIAYIVSTMKAFDSRQERQRLAELYGGMADGELEKLAGEASSLSEVARGALKAELVKRGSNVALSDSAAAQHAEPPQLVTVRQFRDLPEALIAKSILDSADIECFLADENTIRMDWLWSNLLGGVKLWVRAEDAETASAMLDQNRPEAFDAEGVGEYKQPVCPQCQSLDVSFEELIKPWAYTGIFVGLPIPITRRGWKCHECGHSSDESSDPLQEEP
jgi:hypothetical protein